MFTTHSAIESEKFTREVGKPKKKYTHELQNLDEQFTHEVRNQNLHGFAPDVELQFLSRRQQSEFYLTTAALDAA